MYHKSESVKKSAGILDMQDEDIDFIVGKLKEGAFSTDTNWRTFKSLVGMRKRRIGVAAAVTAILALSATAAVFTYRHISASSYGTETIYVRPSEEINSDCDSKLRVFEATGLSEVVQTIESEYRVKISDVPSNADEYVLTLRYEGTPEELIEAINEILGTNLTVEEI